MNDTKNVTEFVRLLVKSISKKTFQQARLYNKRNKAYAISQLRARPVKIKEGYKISVISRTDTQDFTKNYTEEEFIEHVKEQLTEHFFIAEFLTNQYKYFLTIYPNGKSKLRHKVSDQKTSLSLEHNAIKNRFIKAENNEYLRLLNITGANYTVKNKSQDKFKQINKYVEIIHDILKKKNLEDGAKIVDMGSGKGYLTFALYDYFQTYRKQTPLITGIEMRPELVNQCNEIAQKCGYDMLRFKCKMIQEVEDDAIDMLIALHACDTATDDAIFKGIKANAKIILCAPCCHKQVRKRMNPTNIMAKISEHGILKERQAEILTDTIRAMILEAHGYKTRVFEFISTSHTPKNVLIVGLQEESRKEPDLNKMKEIQTLKDMWGISFHYLERLVQNN